MPSARTRHSRRKVDESYAKPWDKAQNSEKENQIVPKRWWKQGIQKSKEKYAKEVVDAGQTERKRIILPSHATMAREKCKTIMSSHGSRHGNGEREGK